MNGLNGRTGAMALLSACLCLGMGCVCNGTEKATPFAVASNGRPATIIVTGGAPSEPEAFAANELQKYVKQISGAELKIVKGGEAPANAILIGTMTSNPAIAKLAGKLPEKPDGLGKEGFEIAVVDGRLVIAGGGSVGALYGTYGLLEKFGCRWFFPDKDWEIIPTSSNLSVESSLRMVERPSFKGRECWQGFGLKHLDWMAKNRCNYLVIPWFLWSEEAYAKALPDIRKRGIEIELGHDGVVNYWLPIPRYLKDHPEYYALIGGKNRPQPYNSDNYKLKDVILGQFCFSNLDGAKETAKNICEFLDKHSDIKTVGLGISDEKANAAMCQCDKCKDLVIKYGQDGHVNYTGAFLYFANNVATAVAEKHPEATITFGAYEYPSVFEAPIGIKAAPNLRLIAYLFLRNGAKAIDDDTSKRNSYICNEIEKWKNVFDAKRIVIGDYYYGMSGYRGGIWAIFKVIPQDFQYFAKNGFHGASLACGYKFSSRLNSWLFYKYAWNANADIDAQLDDFCAKYFEGASAPMRRYVEMLSKMMRNYEVAKTQNIPYTYAPNAGKDDFLPAFTNILAMFDEKRLQALEECLAEARNMVPKNSAAAKRIDNAASELGLSAAYVRLNALLLNMGSALTEKRNGEMMNALDKAIKLQKESERIYKDFSKDFQMPDLTAIKNALDVASDSRDNLVKNPSGEQIAQYGEAARNAKAGAITATDRPEGWNVYQGEGAVKWGACNDANSGRSVFIEALAPYEWPDGRRTVSVALLPSGTNGYTPDGAFSCNGGSGRRTYGLSLSAKGSDGVSAKLLLFTWNSKGERKMTGVQMLKPFTPGTAYSQFFGTFTLPEEVVKFSPAFHLSSTGRLDVRNVSIASAKPMVGIYVPSADFVSAVGLATLFNTIAKDGSFRGVMVYDLSPTSLAKCQGLIIPQLQAKSQSALCEKREEFRKYVENGGRIFMLRSTCGYKPHGWPIDGTIFPEVCEGVSGKVGSRGDDNAGRALKVASSHPVAAGLMPGETGRMSYWDHYALIKGRTGETVMVDRDGAPVVIAGKFGKGKVVFAGFTPTDAQTDAELPEMDGFERLVLLNSIQWFMQ